MASLLPSFAALLVFSLQSNSQYTYGVNCYAGSTINPTCSAYSYESGCAGTTAHSYTCFANATACPVCPPGTYQPQGSIALKLCTSCYCGSGPCCLDTNPVSSLPRALSLFLPAPALAYFLTLSKNSPRTFFAFFVFVHRA